MGGRDYGARVACRGIIATGRSGRCVRWKFRATQGQRMARTACAKLGIGYFRANSTALCAVEDCSIVSPLLLKTLLALRAALAAGALPRGLREIEAFVDAADARLLLTATFAGFPSRAAEHAETFRRVVPEIASLLFHDPSHDRMELYGPGFLEYAAGGISYRVGHFSFFQVNRFLVEELARVVVEGEEGGRLALDLFAGVGLFSIPLAKRFARVLAVESNPASARDLETNMRGQGAIEVRSAEVEQFLKRNKERPELVVLDPPRAGLTPESVERLGQAARRRGLRTYPVSRRLWRAIWCCSSRRVTSARKCICLICFLRRFIWRRWFGCDAR